MSRPYALAIVAAAVLVTSALAWGGTHQPAPSASTTAPSRARVLWSVTTNQKVVALTFDDGPDPKYTPKLLEIAKAKGVKLTFFLVGKNVAAHPELAQAEVAQGHAVGNHTWDHWTMTGLNERRSRSEITRCQEELDRVCGPRPHLLRPPKGKWDDDTYQAASSLGYTIVLWSLELEHHPKHSAQELARRTAGLVRPGTIILADDGEANQVADRTKTLQAVTLLIDELQRQGYRFVTIPELVELEKGPTRTNK